MTYELYVEKMPVTDLLDAHRRAIHAHGWSDNSFSYDLGTELEYLLPDDAVYDDEGEPLVDYEDLGDMAMIRIGMVSGADFLAAHGKAG